MTNANPNPQEIAALTFQKSESSIPTRPTSAFIQLDSLAGLDAETIIGLFQPVIEEQFKATLIGWKRAHHQKLRQFVDTIEAFSMKLDQMDDTFLMSGTAWREFEITLNETYEWIISLANEVPVVNLWAELRSQFSETLKSIPKVAEVLIPSDYLMINSDVIFWNWAWKEKRQPKIVFKGAAFVVWNQVRRIFRKAPLNPLPLQRTIHLHSFLTYFLEIPTADFLLAEWLQFLQQLAKQLYELHTRTVEIKNNLLFPDDFEPERSWFDASNMTDQVEKIQSNIRSVKSYFQDLDHFETEALQRFYTYQTEVYGQFKHHWGFAGTHILPNSDFGAKKIAENWRNLEKRLAEATKSWIHHFQGEQGEWVKDIELSMLQLQTAQICSSILNDIELEVNSRLLPALAETQEAVTASLNSFSTMTAENGTGSRYDIVRQNRLILQSIRREKLPLLIDTFEEAQLNSIMLSWASRIRVAIDILAEKHIIFVDRDLSKALTQSKIESTSVFKRVVVEDLFSKSQHEHQKFIADNEQNIRKINRGISMIDQIIEVNLDAALSLLAQQQGTEVVQDARDALIEGLNHTSLKLSDLATQVEQLLAVSKNNLVQISGAFATRLQNLGDREELNKAHLRLTSTKLREKIWDYYRRYLDLLKSIPENLFNLLADKLQRFRNYFFRLREITGMVSDKTDAEENLSRFLTETEKHINSLPDKYQRLFRLESMSDERFFAARDTELALLKDEFERWQNGKFATIALIGERGCGKTTLLNFAEQQIYEDYTVSKINFLDSETIFTEEVLFDFMKSELQKTDLNSDLNNLDELEDMMKDLAERRIIIVENLQQLFLRTTYGFDALERFLLFISRTHQQIHWIMTCTIYSWEYFTKVINIAEYVQREIILDTLPQEELEEIIMKRHAASGYQLCFQATEEIATSRRFKKLNSDKEYQAFLRNLFFKQLTKLADGNITVAILLWLRSYEEFSQDTLTLPATIDFDSSFLYELPAEDMFTLAALLQHDILSDKHHALIFHQDTQQSLLVLSRLVNKGFLVQKSIGYQIHPFLYRSIVRVLKSGNIIH